jgi:hypothetical protein
MKMRWMSITFLGICMIVGLSTALLSHSVEAALTLPLSIRIGPVATTPAKSAPVSPTVTVRPVMPSTPPAGAVTILAQDSFKRANQIFWGTATDGKQWIGDANSIEVFSIVGNAGQVDHAQGTFNAILGPAATDSEVVFSGVVNQFAAGASINMGAVLRWTDNNNWYKALINGSNLQILRHVKGTTTSLGSVPFSAQGGVTYTLRFRAIGAALFVKAWQSNQPEPNAWMLTVMDTMLSKGSGGLRFLVQTGSVIRITSFHETTVQVMI